MADEHDDLLNFEIGDGDFADGTLNEDELLLSDEENFDDHKDVVKKVATSLLTLPEKIESPKQSKEIQQVNVEKSGKTSEKIEKSQKIQEVFEPPAKIQKIAENTEKVTVEKPQQKVQQSEEEKFYEDEKFTDDGISMKDESKVEPKKSEPEKLNETETHEIPESSGLVEIPEQPSSQNDPENHQTDTKDANIKEFPHHLLQQQQFGPMGPRQFRPNKFQPRGMPRWMNPVSGPAPVPFPQQRPMRPPQMGPIPPGGRMPMNGPLQMRQSGPFPPQRAPFFMPARPGAPGRPPIPGPSQRFFYPNQPPSTLPGSSPAYVPTPITPAMPRKVLINPNFKGGIEAVKSQLLKEHFSSQSSMTEEELLRKQQEFINSNMRSIEKRRHERSPSPNYSRRSYSHSPSPPRNYRRRPFRPYERRKSMGDGNKAKEKDENLPEEDEETRAYRLKIESQRKQREELLRQKELRRKQQMVAKAKETEPLKPLVVTEKKIILTKKAKLEEKSTTPPIDDAPLPPTLTAQRRILLKKEIKNVSDGKIGIAGSEKRKLQKIIKAEN